MRAYHYTLQSEQDNEPSFVVSSYHNDEEIPLVTIAPGNQDIAAYITAALNEDPIEPTHTGVFLLQTEFDHEPSYIVKQGDDEEADALVTVRPGYADLGRNIVHILNQTA